VNRGSDEQRKHRLLQTAEQMPGNRHADDTDHLSCLRQRAQFTAGRTFCRPRVENDLCQGERGERPNDGRNVDLTQSEIPEHDDGGSGQRDGEHPGVVQHILALA
jgi:hypothetical protein